MKTNTLLVNGTNHNYEQININHIVYEQNDDGLLIDCNVKRNKKAYRTNFCIDFKELNNIICKAYNKIDSLKLTELISDKLFGSSSPISDLNIKKQLGESIKLNNYSFQGNYQELLY